MNNQNKIQETEELLDVLINALEDVTQGVKRVEYVNSGDFFRKLEGLKVSVEESELLKQFKIFEEIATLEAIKEEVINANVSTKGFIKKIDNKIEELKAQVE
jgi:hypothetical protein